MRTKKNLNAEEVVFTKKLITDKDNWSHDDTLLVLTFKSQNFCKENMSFLGDLYITFNKAEYLLNRFEYKLGDSIKFGAYDRIKTELEIASVFDFCKIDDLKIIYNAFKNHFDSVKVK